MHQDIPLIRVFVVRGVRFHPEQLAGDKSSERRQEAKDREGEVQYQRQSYCDALLLYSTNGSDDGLSRVNEALGTIGEMVHSKMMQLDDYMSLLKIPIITCTQVLCMAADRDRHLRAHERAGRV